MYLKDFMYQLTDKEVANLRSQFVTSSWGGRRYNPYAFTEQGVAMLSSVLNSERAVKVNIQIMRERDSPEGAQRRSSLLELPLTPLRIEKDTESEKEDSLALKGAV